MSIGIDIYPRYREDGLKFQKISIEYFSFIGIDIPVCTQWMFTYDNILSDCPKPDFVIMLLENPPDEKIQSYMDEGDVEIIKVYYKDYKSNDCSDYNIILDQYQTYENLFNDLYYKLYGENII